MQIVIDIPKRIKELCDSRRALSLSMIQQVEIAISAGTPLPEHCTASAEKVGEPIDVIHTKEYGDIVICSQDQFEYLPPTSLREAVRLYQEGVVGNEN